MVETDRTVCVNQTNTYKIQTILKEVGVVLVCFLKKLLKWAGSSKPRL